MGSSASETPVVDRDPIEVEKPRVAGIAPSELLKRTDSWRRRLWERIVPRNDDASW